MKIKLKISKKVFNEIYIPFLNLVTRVQIFFGGSSSGKSYFLAQRCVLDVAQGGHNYLCTRKVAKTIRSSTYNEIVKAINRLKLSNYFTINKTDMVITCVNGYQILFAGLDDVEKIKSITPQKGVITDIWVEEATETERTDVKQLQKRLRGLSKVKKRLILSFNPILQTHWIYQEYFGNWDDSKNLYQDEDISVLRTTYRDNKFLTDDDRMALENESDPYFKAVYTDGKWGILGAVIFRNWRVEDCSEVRKIADKFKNGLDFGYGGDPAAVAHTYHDKARKRIYILDELYQKGLTNDLLAEEVKKIIRKQYITCDSAEPKSIQELKNFGVNALAAKKGKDSVNFGIQWLQRQEIIIDISCTNTKNEFQQYKWKEDKNGNALQEAVDKFNHIIDALRYAYESEMTGSKDSLWSW
jgi:phage terminase large subunit